MSMLYFVNLENKGNEMHNTRAPQKPIDSLKQSVVPVYFLDFGVYSLHLFFTGIIIY